MDFIKNLKIFPLKDSIKKIRRQVTDLEKSFIICISGKGLYPEYRKNSYRSRIRKQLNKNKQKIWILPKRRYTNKPTGTWEHTPNLPSGGKCRPQLQREPFTNALAGL